MQEKKCTKLESKVSLPRAFIRVEKGLRPSSKRLFRKSQVIRGEMLCIHVVDQSLGSGGRNPRKALYTLNLATSDENIAPHLAEENNNIPAKPSRYDTIQKVSP